MQHYGFTFDWIKHQNSDRAKTPSMPDYRALDFMVKHGFNYARIPFSYWYFFDGFDYGELREDNLGFLDSYLSACQERGIQMCLSMYRAPGHCIDTPGREIHQLWKDSAAQKAMLVLWEAFAARYRQVAPAELCFELLSDAPPVGTRDMTRADYVKVIRKVVMAVRAIDPQRELMAPGIDYGGEPLQELSDLGITQCAHGEYPLELTQLGTGRLFFGEKEGSLDYPRERRSMEVWNKASMEKHLRPWREWQLAGHPVFVGSFGFSNALDNWIAIAWFRDFLALCKEYGWGYCLAGFHGRFGLVEHKRYQTYFHKIDGYKVDRGLLELLSTSRQPAATQSLKAGRATG